LRCHAIAVRSWEIPISSVGSVVCRVKKTLTPARRAASRTHLIRPVTCRPSALADDADLQS